MAENAMDLAKDDFVCMVGIGTANMLHEHGKVVRTTKVFVVAEITSSNLNRPGHTARFRRDSGRSVPYSDYGGSHVYTTCQRPKQKD